MAGTRKSARMSERRRLEEEDEERKREDDRKRQRTLFQRTDNVIRKNDLVVDTSTGKVVLSTEQVPEDVKVKVEVNDLDEEIDHLNHSEISQRKSEEVIVTSEVDIPTEARQVEEDLEDNRPETDDNNGAPISDSSEVEVKQELSASQNTTGTNEQFEAKLTSLTLELEETKQLVKEQHQKIVQLSTELETVKTKEQENTSQFATQLESVRLEMNQKIVQLSTEVSTVKAKDQEKIRQLTSELESEKKKTTQRLEEHGKMSVNQLTREVEAIKRKSEEENNLRREGYTQLEPQNPDISESDRKPEGNPDPGHSEDAVASSSVTYDHSRTVTATTKAQMMEDPDANMKAVLSRILKYVETDFLALKTFRLVSRTWNQVSLPTWRKVAVIIILPIPIFSKKGAKGIHISEFLMEFQDDQSPYGFADKPYSQYKLENHLINEDETQHWNRFWDLIGPLMVYMHFQNCGIANITSDALPKLLIEKMPNLKELALTSVEYDQFKWSDTNVPLLDRNHLQLQSLRLSGNTEIYLDRLLVCLPSLTSLSAFNEEEKRICHENLDAVCLAKSRNEFTLPNLKHLDFLNAQIQLLPFENYIIICAKLQLESLAININPTWKKKPSNILPRLSWEAITLKVLKVFQAPTNLPVKPFFTPIQLTTLKELHLWGSIVQGLDFLKYMPNLKLLYINLVCFEKRENVKQDVNRLPRGVKYTKFEEDLVDNVKDRMEGVVVTSLETLHIDFEFPEESLRTLAKWTPNLKILKTIVSSNNASAVVEGWRELKEMTCLFESTIRDGNICKEDSILRRNNGAVISDSKKLEHFQLDCLCDASNLTDLSVFLGFLKMRSLRSIQICVTKQFSDEAEEAIRQGVKSCRVIRNYTGGDHSNYGCCQRREFDREVASTGLRVKSKKIPVRHPPG